jgi:hypothetical protein
VILLSLDSSYQDKLNEFKFIKFQSLDHLKTGIYKIRKIEKIPFEISNFLKFYITNK